MALRYNFSPNELITRRDEFIEKVRSDIRSSGSVAILYDGHKIEIRRACSKKAINASSKTKVGEFYGYTSNTDIIDKCTEFVISYHQRQAEQSERLAKAMGY